MASWLQFNPWWRYPRASLALTLALALPLASHWFGFDVTTETRALLEGDQRNLASYEKVTAILGEETVIAISLECDDVFSPAGMDAIRRVSDAFTRQPGLADVKSFTHSVRPVRRGLQFEMVPLVSAHPDTNELARLRQFALENPLVRNVMVSPDARHTVLLNTYRRVLSTPAQRAVFRAEIQQILAPFEAEGLRFAVLGLPLIETEVRETLQRDIRWFVPTALLVLLVVLGCTLRSPLLVGLVTLNQAIVIAVLPGLIDFTGHPLNVFTAMLFPLLTAIHLRLLVYVVNAWQAALATGQPAEPALEAALNEVIKPSNFAMLTTAVGLGALLVSSVRQVREFGWLGAGGVGLLYLMTFGPGVAALRLACRFHTPPAALAKLRGAVSVPSAGPPDDWLATSGGPFAFAQRHRRAILIALGFVAVLSGVGLTRLRTDVRAVEFLSRSSPTRQAVEQLDAVYGGINVVQIELDSGRNEGINTLDFLRYLETLQHYAEAQPEVSGAYSYAQLLAMMNQIWEQERPGSFRVPTNSLVLGTFTLALRSYPLPFLAALANPSARTAYLIVRTRDMPAQRYLAVLQRILEYAEASRPSAVRVSAARGIHSILEADRRILRSQLNSALVTLGLMGLALAGLWRSFRLAGWSLLVNLLPVGLMMAGAAFAQVPLNSVTIMVAAICLGIAVDDSVHVITHWREQCRRGLSPEAALRDALHAKTRPIVGSSLVLIGVFAIFGLSSFPPVVHFGLMAAGAFLAAVLSVLLGLPALLLSPRYRALQLSSQC